ARALRSRRARRCRAGTEAAGLPVPPRPRRRAGGLARRPRRAPPEPPLSRRRERPLAALRLHPGGGVSTTTVKDLEQEDLEALKHELEQRLAQQGVTRWNPQQEDVERAVVQLVLTLVELLRELMERQAIKR